MAKPSTSALVAIGAVAFFVLILFSFRGSGKVVLTGDSVHYGIMLDAGSTGSRIHTFRYVSDGSDFILESEEFRQLKPGLSAFRSDPEGAANSLRPLLDEALTIIPASMHAQTPVNLKATAGLRLLKPEESEAILKAVRQLIKSYPFMFDSNAVEVIEGTDEGIFGWITINYLLEKIGAAPEETATILDLGGGSTQIAMSVVDESLPEVKVGSDSHHMFSFSHLGYGLMAGRAGVIAYDIPNGDPSRHGQQELVHKCFPPGVTVEYQYNGEVYIAKGHDDHSADACHEITTKLIHHPDGSFSQSQPKVTDKQTVYVLSYYFDRAIDIGLIQSNSDHGKLTLQDFWKGAQKACGLTPAQVIKTFPLVSVQNAPFLCLDLCYITSLLEDGFHLSPERTLTLSRKLPYNGIDVETSWPLGASLIELSDFLTH